MSAGAYPKPLEQLARSLSALPGIGRRTAERLALALLDWEDDQLAALGDLIATLKNQITFCKNCGNLAESDKCAICLDPNRDHKLICVVENAKQIQAIDKCGRFHGVFHVLGGRVSPLDNIGIEDLNIHSLFRRIRRDCASEVILATSPDVEGEATATYLASELQENHDVMVTRIALGVPVGSDLTFADSATMAMAIDSRRSLPSIQSSEHGAKG